MIITMHVAFSCSNGPFVKPKKLAGNQLKHKWLRLDPKGNTVVTQTGKNALMQRLGVQARDLRLLDAQTPSSPPAILCRDRAVVVNLEFIKCIITSGTLHEVMFLAACVAASCRRTALMFTEILVVCMYVGICIFTDHDTTVQ